MWLSVKGPLYSQLLTSQSIVVKLLGDSRSHFWDGWLSPTSVEIIGKSAGQTRNGCMAPPCHRKWSWSRVNIGRASPTLPQHLRISTLLGCVSNTWQRQIIHSRDAFKLDVFTFEYNLYIYIHIQFVVLICLIHSCITYKNSSSCSHTCFACVYIYIWTIVRCINAMFI